ncbi:MAG TPA: DUF1800 domain-containing protein [Steroidobacteraceae bacterium]|jgi:uncharacterized protein (DUF1800 family)|nr:DUF1800 domain-containing protein [Steroidobacteraceae bacterium]
MNARLAAMVLAAAFVVACGGGGHNDPAPVTPPPTQQPPPATISKADAYRFLNQATFGATAAEAQNVITLGYEAWIDQQLQRPASLELPHVQQVFATYPPGADFTKLHEDRVDIWLRHALHAPDQLRQRVAFALSQIMVISQSSALVGYPWGCASYYDMLTQNAFGNFRELMENVTLHPAMGVYLSMLGNQKPDVAHNIRPDENYARELMQLFTVGLVELNLDGSVKTDSAGQPIPTYDQDIVQGFAHVYTGWTYSGAPSFAAAIPTIANQIRPMQAYSEQHATGTKRMLSYAGAVSTIPAGQTPEQDLDAALDNIFNHPNVGPFIAKRLIQHLVTSNPSPQYVERIARKFNDDGAGKRGNLAAVIKAILLDAEARTAPASATAGKLKEPLLRLTQLWRAYDASSQSGKYNVQNITGLIGQGPLQAPSVFNFFSPFYAPPGEIANQGLVAPEMQVTTEYLSSLWTDYVFALAFCYTTMPVQGCPAVPPALQPDLVTIDASAERAMAANPQALVDTIADKLVGGPLSSTLSTEAKSMVERAPASETALRVAEALYLIASAPEVAQQR